MDSDWSIIDPISTSPYSKARSPQLNDDNMSSRQVANASANGSSSSSASVISFSDDDIVHAVYYDEPSLCSAIAPVEKPHVPPSNTDTANSDETVIDPAHKQPQQQQEDRPTPANPQGCAELTRVNMDFHQRELAQRFQGSIPGWVDGAGIGARFLVRSPPASVLSLHSVLTTGGGSSIAGGGAAAADRCRLVADYGTSSADVSAAAGAWCSAMLDAMKKRSIRRGEGEGGEESDVDVV